MHRATARFVLFAITALVIMLFYVPLGHTDFANDWGDGTYGIVAQPQGVTIDSVVPGSPADKAGVHPGDVMVSKIFTPAMGELEYPRAGDRGTFAFQRPNGSTYVTKMTAVPVPGFTWWSRLTGFLAIIPATIFAAIAFLLVYVRPNVMTWCFFAYAIGYYSTAPAFEYYFNVLPHAVYIAMSFVLATFLGNFAVMPLLPFIIRFPNDAEVHGSLRRLDIAIWIAIALAFAAYTFRWYHLLTTGHLMPFVAVLDTWLPLAVFVVAAAIFIRRYRQASPQIRQRFGFLVLGLLVSFVAYAVYFIPSIPVSVSQIIGYAVIIMPITVAYAILRHRVLDINFVLNRAIVYGVVSLFVIAFISLLDWTLGRVVSGQRLATGLELLVTIGVGFLLDRINKGTERLIETVLFRSRRIAEEYMRRVAAALPYATDEEAISDGLVQVPVDALKLTAAAAYRRSLDGGRFEGIATSHDAPMAPQGFQQNHLLVRMLQADEKRVWLEELRTYLDRDNAAIYVLAVPVTVRHELVAFTLYGAHRNGSQIDPEEVELLELLAGEASRAYDHVEAVRTRERYAHFIRPAHKVG